MPHVAESRRILLRVQYALSGVAGVTQSPTFSLQQEILPVFLSFAEKLPSARKWVLE